MRSTRAALLAASTAMLVALTGCTGGGTPEPGTATTPTTSIKLVAAEYSSKTGPYWQKVAQDFKAKTGITVEVQTVSWNDIHQQVSTMVQTNQLPDVLNLDTFADYAHEDLLWSADDVESDALKAKIPANLAAGGEADGKAYALPLIASTSQLFYNKQLFKAAGIDAPPTTPEELHDDAVAIGKLGQSTSGFALSLGPEAAQIDWATFMYNLGGDYRDDSGWTIDSDANVAALQYLATLTADKGTEVNPGKTNRTEGTWQLFEAGKAGMTIGQSALETRLADHPDVSYGVAPFPSSSGTSRSLGVADYLMAFKKPGNQDAVKQFLDFAYDEQNYHTFATQEGLLPVTTAEISAEKSDAKLKPYLDALDNAQFAPVGDQGWDKVLGALRNNIGLGVQGQDPREVLARIQAAPGS